MLHPADKAFTSIENVMFAGSKKEGRSDSWRHRPRIYHILKGIRHATTALMIEQGVIEPDGENHLELALTRLAMALTI